jgi:hypothetical protein
MVDRFVVILAQIDDTSFCLAEGIAACAVEEAGSRTDDCSVHLVPLLAADDCEIRVFANFEQPGAGLAKRRKGRRIVGTYVLKAFINS